jgi:hypothetical protein
MPSKRATLIHWISVLVAFSSVCSGSFGVELKHSSLTPLSRK